MFRVAVSNLRGFRLTGRSAIIGHVHRSRYSDSGSILASSSRIGTTPRRTFHDYGNPLPEPEFTPAETILLDLTGWFVAFALMYVPSSTTAEPWDQTTEDDRSHIKKDHFRPEKKRASSSGNDDQKNKKASSDRH